MPQLGETVAEGKITKWFKSAGDAVKPGDNLFEIETDKISMEVPATSAGTLTTINFGVGEVAPVGAVVAVISGAGEAAEPASAAPPNAPQLPKAPQQTPFVPAQAGTQGPQFRSRGNEGVEASSRTSGSAYPHMDPFREVRTPERNFGPARVGGVHVTPLARRLAGERGIDLANVKGSGPHGRIVAGDVENVRATTRRGDGNWRQRRAGQGAVSGKRLRGSAARRHARHHRAAANRSRANDPAFLPDRRH